MTERGMSATSDAISTPPFMGPGCMTSAASGIASTPAGDSPHRRGVLRAPGGGGGVLVGAPPRFQRARRAPIGEGAGARGGGVPEEGGVGSHRRGGGRGSLEALPLGPKRTAGGEVDHVRREPFGRQLEGD